MLTHEDKSTSTDAWSLMVSVVMIILKGVALMIFFGDLGNDDLTGNGGSDTYFFSDFLEGVDTIRTFSAARYFKIWS